MKMAVVWLVTLILAGCGGDPKEAMPVGYATLTQNAGRFYADQTKIELQGQVVELVESADYAELGDPAGPNADVVLTVESFLLYAGEPLSASTLKKLHRAFEEDGIFGRDAGKVLKDQDLDLVLVRWTAPPDIVEREDPLADPYPVTPGSEVTVQGVLTSGTVEPWRHCQTYRGPYGNHIPCTNIPDVSGLRLEATRVEDVESVRFGSASGPLGQ